MDDLVDGQGGHALLKLNNQLWGDADSLGYVVDAYTREGAKPGKPSPDIGHANPQKHSIIARWYPAKTTVFQKVNTTACEVGEKRI